MHFNQKWLTLAAILNYCLGLGDAWHQPVKELAWAARHLRTGSEWNGLAPQTLGQRLFCSVDIWQQA